MMINLGRRLGFDDFETEAKTYDKLFKAGVYIVRAPTKRANRTDWSSHRVQRTTIRTPGGSGSRFASTRRRVKSR